MMMNSDLMLMLGAFQLLLVLSVIGGLVWFWVKLVRWTGFSVCQILARGGQQ
ncbi:hypothetical protein [Phaeobacter inhibens]|uniref:hypothetical protein n=1 Tax=Phaeobacter inhibens TaxID=221822 RepID=UPI00295EF96A|nr:hypothetical protein [Phaeobacter inhibens]